MERARRCMYTTIYGQSFSPCGTYLATADNFGTVAVFSLPSILSPEAKKEHWKPIYTFQGHSGPVYCLVSSDQHLISAGTGDIKCWKWHDILAKAPKPVWSLPIPVESKFDDPETNSVVLDEQAGYRRLYAGCGNKQVHAWDLEAGKLLGSFRGHTDYVHCVALRNNGRECVSGSEDGSVRIWDSRTPSSEAVHVLKPYQANDCSRPHLGKWIGCVSVDSGDDFLVCGGGPSLAMWHLRSLAPTTVYSTPEVCQNYVMFYQDTIISAGSEPFVNHWHINGERKQHVPCSPSSVFTVAINQHSESTKILTVGGSGNKVDVCTNFGYKAFSLLTS